MVKSSVLLGLCLLAVGILPEHFLDLIHPFTHTHRMLKTCLYILFCCY